MNKQRTIVLVLYNGKDFGFRDVELIVKHINGKWKSLDRPRIICLWDQASKSYNLGNLEIIPLHTSPGVVGTWSRIELYSPAMEQYKPFLYVDLDTAVIESLENIFDLVKDEDQFITLEDFWQKGKVATGLVWFPKNHPDTKNIYKQFVKPSGNRMDIYVREKLCKSTIFWQQLTDTIQDFKPITKKLLPEVVKGVNLVCFHGKPRIFEAVNIKWVKDYIDFATKPTYIEGKKVTVIIPYNKDRGWLQDAINSVPKGVQLILSKGDGSWPENFNKVLNEATGDYIKYLHEDDMLTPNCIQDSIKAIEEQGVDFIHGNAFQLDQATGHLLRWRPVIKEPTLSQLLKENTIHSATLMYKKEVFKKVGLLDESDSVNSFEEFEFNLRCLKAGMKIGYCPSFLAYYRRHPKQKIKTTKRAIREQNRKELISTYK
jgi:hypothetical protein